MKSKTKLILVIFFLIIGILINVISSNYLAYVYENDKHYQDLILDKIEGNYYWAMRLSELILLICIISFIFVAINNREQITKWIFIIALFQVTRGIIIPLTLLNPLDSYSFFRSFETFNYGLFPSGHTAIPFLFFLFTYKENRIWIFYLFATILVILLLLLGKQHYTIDVITTIFIAYSIKCFTERNLWNRKK